MDSFPLGILREEDCVVMTIYFLSMTKFPTRKAYGVTLKGTFEAALAEGFHAMILAPDDLKVNGLKSRTSLMVMKILRKFYNFQSCSIAKLAFLLHGRLYSNLVCAQVKANANDIFWVRDLMLAKILTQQFPKNKIIFEIHQLQPKKKLKQIMKLPEDVCICPISQSILRQLSNCFGSRTLTLLPMGVADKFFTIGESDSNPPFYDIGYFGGYTSSGNHQGIDSVLTQLIQHLLTNPQFRVHFAGLGTDGVRTLRRIVETFDLQAQVHLTEHIDHDLVPAAMRECKTLLLPYPEGVYFESRFPIKALEYAASQRPILCSRTISHLNLFIDDEVWFYDLGNTSGILECYEKVSLDKELAEVKIMKAYELSLTYTFRQRFIRVMSLIS